MKREAEAKVRGGMLTEAAVAGMRWAAKWADNRVRDLAWKVNEELWKSQSPAKGKCCLVSHSGFLVVVELNFL